MHGSIWPCPRIIQLFITLFWARSFKDFIELRWVLRALVYNVMYVRCASLYSMAEFVSDIALLMKNYFKILVKRANLHVTFYSFCSNGSFLTWPETKQKEGIGESVKKSCGMQDFREKEQKCGITTSCTVNDRISGRGAYFIIHVIGAALIRERRLLEPRVKRWREYREIKWGAYYD